MLPSVWLDTAVQTASRVALIYWNNASEAGGSAGAAVSGLIPALIGLGGVIAGAVIAFLATRRQAQVAREAYETASKTQYMNTTLGAQLREYRLLGRKLSVLVEVAARVAVSENIAELKDTLLKSTLEVQKWYVGAQYIAATDVLSGVHGLIPVLHKVHSLIAANQLANPQKREEAIRALGYEEFSATEEWWNATLESCFRQMTDKIDKIGKAIRADVDLETLRNKTLYRTPDSPMQ